MFIFTSSKERKELRKELKNFDTDLTKLSISPPARNPTLGQGGNWFYNKNTFKS